MHFIQPEPPKTSMLFVIVVGHDEGYESKSKIITMIAIRRYSHRDAEAAGCEFEHQAEEVAHCPVASGHHLFHQPKQQRSY